MAFSTPSARFRTGPAHPPPGQTRTRRPPGPWGQRRAGSGRGGQGDRAGEADVTPRRVNRSRRRTRPRARRLDRVPSRHPSRRALPPAEPLEVTQHHRRRYRPGVGRVPRRGPGGDPRPAGVGDLRVGTSVTSSPGSSGGRRGRAPSGRCGGPPRRARGRGRRACESSRPSSRGRGRWPGRRPRRRDRGRGRGDRRRGPSARGGTPAPRTRPGTGRPGTGPGVRGRRRRRLDRPGATPAAPPAHRRAVPSPCPPPRAPLAPRPSSAGPKPGASRILVAKDVSMGRNVRRPTRRPRSAPPAQVSLRTLPPRWGSDPRPTGQPRCPAWQPAHWSRVGCRNLPRIFPAHQVIGAVRGSGRARR